jgi:hypothetical protein
MYEWKSRYGESLIDVEGFYLSKKAGANNPINLNLIFSGEVVGITLSRNGEGVVARSTPCQEVDLGEYGQIAKRKIPGIDSLVGGVLESCEAVTSRAYGDELGLRIQFSNGSLFILNVGDEMLVGQRMPEIE